MELSDRVRLGHVSLEVTSVARARRFYDRFLPVLGFRRLPILDAAWLGYRKGRVTLWMTPSRPTRTTRRTPRLPSDGRNDPISDHLGFHVPSVRQVREIERELRRQGLEPVYAFDKQATRGPSWYVSSAWADPDNNVLEIYAVSHR